MPARYNPPGGAVTPPLVRSHASSTVALSGTLTSPSFLRQFTWRQQVATQYGGILVEDQLSLTTPGGGLSWDRTLHDTNAPEVSK